MYRSLPPLTPIDRFLWNQHAQNNIALGSNSNDAFVLPNEQSLNWIHAQVPPLSFRNRILGKHGDITVGRRNNKKVSRVSLMKGQWTDDEDRKLMRLVNQYGVKKWAQIAEKLDGRAGKQCRERWHNHLRPDIKKESWSEEEERILVETHAKVGNRWAEIAKCIPGRTENTIKNHWNATKRRQNSNRKKKVTHTTTLHNKKPRPSILEDYIRSKTMITSDTIQNNNIIAENQSEPSSESTLFNDNSFISEPYDEELLHLQGFFANYQNQKQFLSVDTDHSENSSTCFSLDLCQQHNENHYITDKNTGSYENLLTDEVSATSTTYSQSDLYISHLLNGPPSSSYLLGYENHQNLNMNFIMGYEDSSYQKPEMDLMEMLSSKFTTSTNTSI